MVQGSGVIRIPAAGQSMPFSLTAEGCAPGSRGLQVPSTFRNGELVFHMTPELNGRWLYAAPVREN
jgi:hypothetical protein